MKWINLWLVFICCLSGCASRTQSNIASDYVFEQVNIIPMDKERVINNQAVAVKDGKIIAIVDQKYAYRIQTDNRIDGQGRYLMPGLADMHVHVRWNPEVMFNLFIANGVTTVANMRLLDGEGAIDHLKLRAQIKSGEILGPRYLVSGHHMEGDKPASINDVNYLLQEHVEKGIDFVKIHGDLNTDIYDALVSGAKARGLKVVGHAQHKLPLKKSLVLNSLEHMEEFLYVSRGTEFSHLNSENFLPVYRENVQRLRDTVYRLQIVDDVAAAGVFIDPTLLVYKMVGVWATDEELVRLSSNPELRYLPSDVREYWLSTATNPYQDKNFPITKAEVDSNLEVMFLLTKELHDSGVPLLLGTDTFGTLVPGIATHDELAILVAAGLTPFEALRCATVNVAKYLGEENIAGQIHLNARADFMLLDKNPLLDIANSRSLSGVFTHGHWYSRADLNTLLDSALHQ